ncbi:hypothetical protein BTR22_12600 [Alkalihalophilus pseudofirmus]|uniref:hypothetical protein n=1 Tax=Alkalihalophilus pseudofirmus TaxID=79885 RepID=UPI00095288FD|nr:hypothetical protein BTR22_12600 [Alkalihalophilus pseudofirmus]
MYDPTIFENLKVAIENTVYDLDNIDQLIEVSGRKDLMDMAVMSRMLELSFYLKNQTQVEATIHLDAAIEDLAAEILEEEDQQSGCVLRVSFQLMVKDPDIKCMMINELLKDIWQPELAISQKVACHYPCEEGQAYENTVTILFPRKINEDQMEQLPEFIEHILISLERLNDLD